MKSKKLILGAVTVCIIIGTVLFCQAIDDNSEQLARLIRNDPQLRPRIPTAGCLPTRARRLSIISSGIGSLLPAATTEEKKEEEQLKSSPVSSPDPSLVDCPALLHAVHRTGQQWDPNDGTLFARFTKLSPQFWISLHNFDFDKVRYGTLHWGKYYEKALSKAFTEVLTAPDLVFSKKRKLVIDVGGNIGWFSLLSAALGCDVHVFEPNIVNVIRFCESQCLNGWISNSTAATTSGDDPCSTMGLMYQSSSRVHTNGNMQIRKLGLKDQVGDFWLSQTRGSYSTGAGKIGNVKLSEASVRVQVTTIDKIAKQLGWLDDNTIIPILKVDVEGLEHDVFRGGKMLIESNRVQNIFMEGNVKNQVAVQEFYNLVRNFQSVGYIVHQMGGSSGPANGLHVLEYPDNDHANFTDGLLYGCRGFAKQNRHQCNIWWKLRDSDEPGASSNG